MNQIPNGVSWKALQEAFAVMIPISDAEFQIGDEVVPTIGCVRPLDVKKYGEDLRMVLRRFLLSHEGVDHAYFVNDERIILASFYQFYTPVDGGGACSSYDLPNLLKKTVVFHDMSHKTPPQFPITVNKWNMTRFKRKTFPLTYCQNDCKDCHCQIPLDPILESCSQIIVYEHLRTRCKNQITASGVSAVLLCSRERVLAIQIILGRADSQPTYNTDAQEVERAMSTDSESETLYSEV